MLQCLQKAVFQRVKSVECRERKGEGCREAAEVEERQPMLQWGCRRRKEIADGNAYD